MRDEERLSQMAFVLGKDSQLSKERENGANSRRNNMQDGEMREQGYVPGGWQASLCKLWGEAGADNSRFT